MALSGRIAIVTGAARGVGRGYAERLAAEGATVVVADSQGAEEAAAAIGGGATGIEVDVSDQASTLELARRTAEAFGGIDILVNAAALEADEAVALSELPLETWQRFLDHNLTGALLCAQAVVPHMQGRGRGRIVNQSSAAANAAADHDALTQLGIQGLTVGLARTLGKHGITVNAIARGSDDLPSAIPGPASVEQLADALVFLVSDASDMVTGQVLRVDGGTITHPA